ncbi:hypothetical protein JCM10550A_17690 [Methanogenium cariaci]|jgi:4-hydroxybenzoate polyprenyltransferase
MGETSVYAHILIARVPDSVLLSTLIFIVGIFYGDLFSDIGRYLLMFLSLFLIIYGIYLGNSSDDRAGCMQEEERHLPTDAKILKITAVSSITTGLLLSLYFGAPAFLFALACSLLFLLYNSLLKRVPLLKDIIVGFGFTFPLLYGALIHSGDVPPILFYFVVLSFLAGFGIEILCDIRDREEDVLSHVNTLPVITSEKCCALITSAIFGCIIILDPLPFFWDIDAGLYRNYIFLFLIIIPVATFAVMIFSLSKNAGPDNAGRWITYARPAMLAGCLAYVLGVVFQDQFICFL